VVASPMASSVHATLQPAVLRCARPRQLKTQPRLGSDGHGQLVERHRHTPIRRLLNGQLVVSAPKVLDEPMPGDDDSGATVLLEPSHRSQARLQPAVIRLDAVVGVPVGAVPCRRQQLLQQSRLHRRLIGGDLSGPDLGADGPLQAPTGGRGILPRGDEHVDDLPKLVDRPVHIPPPPGHLHSGAASWARSASAAVSASPNMPCWIVIFMVARRPVVGHRSRPLFTAGSPPHHGPARTSRASGSSCSGPSVHGQAHGPPRMACAPAVSVAPASSLMSRT
jgi:hypothetical protein